MHERPAWKVALEKSGPYALGAQNRLPKLFST
jgi:hypothetical protein